MERTDQDADGRFQGGIFSGQGKESERDTAYQNDAAGKGNPQGQQEDYGGRLVNHVGEKQGNYCGPVSGNIGKLYRNARPYDNASYNKHRGAYNPVSYNRGYYNNGYYNNHSYDNSPYGSSSNYSDACDNRSNLNENGFYGNMYRKYNGYHNGHPNNYRKNQCPCGCQECPDHVRMGQGQMGQAAILIFAVTGMGMLFLAFLATLFFLVCVVSGKPSAAGKSEISTVYEKVEPDMPFLAGEPENVVPDSGKEPGAEAGNHGEYYGEIKDAVRTDLPYSIEWENYEYEGNNDTTLIAIDYPVIEGDVPNIGLLNDMIASEIDYFEEYYKEYSQYMLSEEIFAVYSEGYVTYMDEEVMSVVFNEKIYTDYWADCGLYCVNIDMANGVVLDNSSILDMDDEFAVDFRTRSRAQNGDVSALDYLTDQEVAYYLTNGSTGIIFYTPLGMEIGLNYGEDYVTVTYRDYKDFLLKY